MIGPDEASRITAEAKAASTVTAATELSVDRSHCQRQKHVTPAPAPTMTAPITGMIHAAVPPIITLTMRARYPVTDTVTPARPPPGRSPTSHQPTQAISPAAGHWLPAVPHTARSSFAWIRASGLPLGGRP